ncbi:hypothetical protein KA093_03835 [Candidatus Saccharibacteria bacterium]|nr:hypothetical protein [Candidatus Saccharibacteria bacterium]
MSHYYRTASPAFTSRSERMWRRNQNTVAFAPTIALGPISHTILIALMVAVLGLIYITQVAKTSSYSYDIDALNNKLSQLTTKKEELANQNARLQALKNVENSSVAQAMTTPAKADARN